MKARTVPQVNTWVNGRGCQRACTYLSNAAVAERPVSSRSGRPGRTAVRLAVSALTSRIAVYVTRMYGGVGGALSDGRPYPHIPFQFFSFEADSNTCLTALSNCIDATADNPNDILFPL